MSYLNFDKALMVNLERSLQKEMLRTNRAGVYNSTTLVGFQRVDHGNGTASKVLYYAITLKC